MAEYVTIRFERFLFNGVWKYLYIGQAKPGVTDDDPQWEIIKLDYKLENDNSISIDKIQTLDGVAWDNRASLPWS